MKDLLTAGVEIQANHRKRFGGRAGQEDRLAPTALDRADVGVGEDERRQFSCRHVDAITSKYFVVALIADSARSADINIEGYDARAYDDVKPVAKKGDIVDYALSIRRIGEGAKDAYWIYAGPGRLAELRSYRIGLEKVLFGGWVFLFRADIWFPYICEFLLWLLVYVNKLVKDYGFTIIIITILTRVITYPLSQSSMRSMNRMKMLQPKINHIRERYKSNQKKMNEEI